MHGINCLGEIIHNKQVIESLESKGLRTINTLEDAKGKVIIRAHGTTKENYNYARMHNIELIDLTCPNVLKIHKQIEDFTQKEYFIFLLGVKNHPETIGNYSFCNENSFIIENTSDLLPAINNFLDSGLKNALIISQTTFSVSLFDEITKNILEKLEKDFNIKVEKSICNATNLRQQEAYEISLKSDLIIIIGGKNSSNTKKLYEVSSKNCKNVIHIETKNDLDLNFIKNFENIGIIAGASTPQNIITEIFETINSY
ncbi:MAG: 4-hydroxy-3-methylbut-2-enyl diphosphate reductase [Clostridia bacterium]|nr:4-hydroxy-3-methylbut-2-enyl diphosphate reductase [Clostridia bacterium]